MAIKINWIFNFIQYIALVLVDLFYISFYKDTIRKIAHTLATLTIYPAFLALVLSLLIALVPFSGVNYMEKWRICFAYILSGILFFFLTASIGLAVTS